MILSLVGTHLVKVYITENFFLWAEQLFIKVWICEINDYMNERMSLCHFSLIYSK